jgi:hypothetical protein
MEIKSDSIKYVERKIRYFIMKNAKTDDDHTKESPSKNVQKPILV